MSAKARVLIIEDDPDGRRSVQEAVGEGGFAVVTAARGREGLALAAEQDLDVVLTDLVLPDIDGVEVLKQVRAIKPDLPVIIMTAYGSISSAVGALKAGAYDYIAKPLDMDELQSRLGRAVETRRLRSEVGELHRSLGDRFRLSSMVAASPAMKALCEQVVALADTSATVLVQGESGTGKELVARALHFEGARRAAPFVAVNCGAFAETLLESELFGHEKGAFTGAAARRKGAFERADGGTLFLDEIGDAPRSVQVKLLRVIEEREIVRLGGSESVRVDVRLISATNRDLDEQVAAGEFREDLLYRLKVVNLYVPPLRERVQDIRPLVEHFFAAACKEHGRQFQGIEAACFTRLEACLWPGNVRELRNVIEAAVVMARGPMLCAADLRLADDRQRPGGEWIVPEGMRYADIEREVLMQVLARHKGNRTLAAETLGLSRRTIQRKIKEYDLPF